MNGQDFMRLTKEAFAPFLGEMGFSMDSQSISGRSYRVTFLGARHAVLISYEPGDKYFLLVVFGRENGELTDIDNRLKFLRLSDLNARHIPAIGAKERSENEAAFASVVARDGDELTLLKAAKELRLVLPRHLQHTSA